MNRSLCSILFVVALLGISAVPSRADLLINLYENKANGMTILEINGTLETEGAAQLDTSAGENSWSLGNDGMNNALGLDHPPSMAGTVNSTFRSLTSGSGNLDDFDFPALAQAVFDTDLSFTGAPGFGFQAAGDTFDFVAYATAAPVIVSITWQRLELAIPWTSFTELQSIEYGAYGGGGADGVRIQTSEGTAKVPFPNLASRPDLLIGKKAGNLRGNNMYSRRKASNRQTVRLKGMIGHANKAIVHLRIENDAGRRDRIRFTSTIDLTGGTRTTIFAYPGGTRTQVTAQALAGRYFTKLDPGESEALFFRMKTSRLWAGARSDRKNEVFFECVSGTQRDFGRLEIKYTGTDFGL